MSFVNWSININVIELELASACRLYSIDLLQPVKKTLANAPLVTDGVNTDCGFTTLCED